MKKLKAIHLITCGDVFQVIGVYRNSGLVFMFNEYQSKDKDRVHEYETVVLSESTYYHREMNEARALSKANNVQLFDFASEHFIEALAKMSRNGGDK